MKAPLAVTLSVIVALPAAGSAAGQAAKDVGLPIAPSAPAFTLLGIAPAAVERPGNVVDLAFSVLSATDRVSALPRDYALELAPYWLLSGRDLSYASYARGGGGWDVFRQTFEISVAASSAAATTPDTGATSLGFGVRFALARGPIDTAADAYGYRLDSLYHSLETIARTVQDSIAARVLADARMQALRRKAREGDADAPAQLRARQAEIAAEVEEHLQDVLRTSARAARRIRRLTEDLQVRRTGWALEAAGGTVFDFPARAFDRGTVSRWGAWLNGGYEGRGRTVLAVARYLADERDGDLTSLDVGGRVVYDASPRLSVAGEALARFFPRSDTLGTQYRAAFVADILLARDRLVTVSFGRDFDGKRSGSLIAAVSLVLGFAWQKAIETVEEP